MAYQINDNRPPMEQFLTGESTRAYEFFGAHFVNWDNRDGVVFRVWAPNALSVSVVGDFNGWDQHADYMYKISDAGVWEKFIEGVQELDNYKYCVETPWQERRLKTDPYAFYCQMRPENASRIYDINGYEWHDDEWFRYKKENPHKNAPINVYEINAGSWKRAENGEFLGYRRLADELVPYVKNMGYTHIEFMPLTEFPFDGSWGYQVTGYYAATSRYGEPKDLMYFIDKCHEAGIGVILDWVPAHFPKDGHGLARFDGTGCYEYEDPRIGEHKEWGTYIFNYGRYEVTSFLISSAMFWLDMYHFDGIRVDAVASMLYLDYNRRDGEWLANEFGGRENLVAVKFLQTLNTVVHMFHPTALMIAEESTAWANVTGYPIKDYGLGFDYKWNMGWMNDSLSYISTDPLWRNYHQDQLTFSMVYAFSENFMLPISHDEVVYGKGSLINKMPGEYDQKFAGLRGFVSYMMAHPGKKLMFMGSEIGQFDEWNSEKEIEWDLLAYDKHAKVNRFFAEVNKFYRDVPAMHENDYDWDGFKWIALDDRDHSIIAFRRIALDGSEIICVCNFQPLERDDYVIGVPTYGIYEEVFNSESKEFGGCGITNSGDIMSDNVSDHELDYSIKIKLPPLGVLYFKLKEELPAPPKPKKKRVLKVVKKSKTAKAKNAEDDIVQQNDSILEEAAEAPAETAKTEKKSAAEVKEEKAKAETKAEAKPVVKADEKKEVKAPAEQPAAETEKDEPKSEESAPAASEKTVDVKTEGVIPEIEVKSPSVAGVKPEIEVTKATAEKTEKSDKADENVTEAKIAFSELIESKDAKAEKKPVDDAKKKLI